jgi:hypothetical protein
MVTGQLSVLSVSLLLINILNRPTNGATVQRPKKGYFSSAFEKLRPRVSKKPMYFTIRPKLHFVEATFRIPSENWKICALRL